MIWLSAKGQFDLCLGLGHSVIFDGLDKTTAQWSRRFAFWPERLPVAGLELFSVRFLALTLFQYGAEGYRPVTKLH